MICASIHLMVLLSARAVKFMPTGLLLYGWNLFCCDTTFMMLPQAAVITTLFLFPTQRPLGIGLVSGARIYHSV